MRPLVKENAGKSVSVVNRDGETSSLKEVLGEIATEGALCSTEVTAMLENLHLPAMPFESSLLQQKTTQSCNSLWTSWQTRDSQRATIHTSGKKYNSWCVDSRSSKRRLRQPHLKPILSYTPTTLKYLISLPQPAYILTKALRIMTLHRPFSKSCHNSYNIPHD